MRECPASILLIIIVLLSIQAGAFTSDFVFDNDVVNSERKYRMPTVWVRRGGNKGRNRGNTVRKKQI